MRTRRLILAVLDGFGLSPSTKGNAIAEAATPNLEYLLGHFPFVTLVAHGTEVGLTWGEMGNSEVGHLNIGAGRIVVQDVTRIGQVIEAGTFGTTPVLSEGLQSLKERKGTLHVIGLASNGGVHGQVSYFVALLEAAARLRIDRTILHLVADGRDTPPKSLAGFVAIIDEARVKFGGDYGSLSGRFYAMDRDRHWDRTQAAYEAIVSGTGAHADTVADAISLAYQAGQSDEFIPPTVIGAAGSRGVRDEDLVVFTNHRPDRARQLARALAGDDFTDFTRSGPIKHMITFTNYGVSLPENRVAFETEPVARSLAQALDAAGLRQFHVAETEKYAHVTYFFNGYIEEPLSQERRQLIQSPRVETYDQAPEMSAAKVTEAVLDGYSADTYDVAVVNYANADMVGHTGALAPTIKAIEVIDEQLGQLAQSVLDQGDTLLITADHGNAEQLIHPETGEIDKEHTANPVPLILVDARYQLKPDSSDHPKARLLGTPPVGILADVAPTVLDLLGVDQPRDMTGDSLLPNLKQ